MKCVLNKVTLDIVRVTDEKAKALVNDSGTWSYVNKQEWKKQGRKYGKATK